MMKSESAPSGRRDIILDATLDAVAQHGINGVTHRKIAALAGVPLGSMTYYFTGIDDLLEEAFCRFADRMSESFIHHMGQATNPAMACDALADLICGAYMTTPRNMELMYQLYAYAARRPGLKLVMQAWMRRSQTLLEHWFDPVTARALDAFIEGMTLHYVTDSAPLGREQLRELLGRIAGEEGREG
ncbi:TetR/AcrR family transcriptional regulator [Atlantibacter hermannii]|uniref:TetR/AcrR family transcriptional regulator n=1 Tax=Atlantibacter hermannii TaxID=565 RepID=UPI0022B7AECB|nr:TetR family transcriptional regulator [Atlantibacter hermannii]MCZ7836736.1 TetR family transcriptional regulator [Atlantibacter hermannii]